MKKRKINRNKIIESIELEVGGILIEFLRKKIKNLHLKIYPPFGKVRISAPLRLDIETVKKFINKKIFWIKEHQEKIRTRVLPQELQFISGENHYFFGEKYSLNIVEKSSSNKVLLKDRKLEMHLRDSANKARRAKLLDDFYRREIKKIIPQFITKYEEKTSLKVVQFGVKKMKTRWGTCNSRVRRIWFNLELAKKPLICLEFITAHEITHFLERKHNKRFYALMDSLMSNWREGERELKHK